uniref:Zinc finger protein 541 n=1 Tax=Pyxicephalus adspersus TaxID=30357 RepID=A0AAV2ZQM1_PYXAD|nr:TPA: hypothetical protein GDO54_017416 [Pyxicephalus adspersus]
MFSYSMDGSSQCLVQDTANSQPVEYNLNQPVEKYMSSASTSLDTPLSDQNQKPLDTLSSVQQSFSKVTHPTYESYKLQSQQTFNSLVNFPSLLSQEQSQKHPKMATYFGRDDEQKHDFMKADAPTSYSCPCSVIYSNIGNQKSQVFADCLSSNALKCSSQLTSSKSKDDQNFEINHQQSPSKEHAFCVDNVVSPSQVAVEYFPFSANLPEKKTSDFASFNMFESENTHDLPCEKSNSTDFTDRLSAALRMMELSDSHVALPSSSVVENNLMYTDKGALSRPLQDLQEEDPEDCRRNIFLQGPKRPMGIMKDPMPFVMPVSVPVIVTDHKVNVEEGPLQNQNTKKRKRPCPKSLYIPPPVLDLKLSTTGYFQSKIRSPNTYLQNGIFSYQAYTPPPMLSPIRSGSGLYFNTFCSPSSATGPTFSLPVKETSPCGIMLTKDSMVFTVQPHINIGKRFQAEIPEIQGALCLENDKADLVWKPLKVTKSVSKFLNLACSSAIPGGGNNLEFALHCLHLSQGNLMEALDKLLIKDPLNYFPQWLADYHYAGCDHWSAAEKKLFEKAYRNNRKNFSYIQAMISKKNLHQCVEYYYTWKKRVSFDKRKALAVETESVLDGRKFIYNKNKAKSGDKNTIQDAKEMPSKHMQKDIEDRIKLLNQFPCSQCDRVFDKIKSRNAHMRKHRQQEKMAHSLKICEEESAAY